MRMQTPRRPSFAALLALVALLSLPERCLASEHSDPKLCGRLSERDGVRILCLWGTPRERGYAHGYLMAEEIVAQADAYRREIFKDEDEIESYDRNARAQLRAMKIPPRFAEELRGLFAGIQARLGDQARLDSVRRAFDYDDLIVTNCLPELTRIGCSSFAAWGPLTKDGATISGRNLDWHRLDSLRGGQVIIVYAAIEAKGGDQRDAFGWISVTWPGFIGCLTGMNSEGVTVSMHDSRGAMPTAVRGFTPRAMVLRAAIETARAKSAVKDVRKALSAHLSLVGNNVPISFPYRGKSAAAVFEYDGNRKIGKGLTIRKPGTESQSSDDGDSTCPEAYLACTNHYRKRASPEPCTRYKLLDDRLAELARAGGSVDLDEAWRLLRSVAVRPGPKQRLETFQSVVFEPDRRVMHVAFSTNERPAAENAPVRLDVARLLAGFDAAARR